MSGDFRVTLDDKAMTEYLKSLDAKGVTKILRKGVLKGGNVFKKAIQAQAPVKRRAAAGASGSYTVRKRGGGVKTKSYGTPGELRKSVKVARIKRRAVIGVVVGPMGKNAFMRHWVTGGTKAHVIRPKNATVLSTIFGPRRAVRHPGSKSNPFVTRGARAVEGQAMDATANNIHDAMLKGHP